MTSTNKPIDDLGLEKLVVEEAEEFEQDEEAKEEIDEKANEGKSKSQIK